MKYLNLLEFGRKMRTRRCNFDTIEDQFNFGRYRDLSLADVMDINPSYLDWCIKHCTGVIFTLQETAKEEIKILYPDFIMDRLFEDRRIINVYRDLGIYEYSEDNIDSNDIECEDTSDEDIPTYNRYAGSWAQEIEGYSDDDIDTIFDGDPDAYWNID